MSNLRLLGCWIILLLAVDTSTAQSDVDRVQCPYCDTDYGVFRHGETWTEKDPCVEYICNRGEKLSNAKRCPDLNCGGNRKIILPGQCCQQCATETPMIIDWSEWSVWGGCTASCGGGTRLRTRFCNDSLATESMDVIIRCSGRTLDEEQCNIQPCPIHGNWSDWTPFGTCSKTCEGGIKNRFRTCTNPKPQHGGRDCKGSPVESMECNIHACPIDGVWGNWSEWSSCTVTCGPGTQERTRECTPPRHGGKDCQGPSRESRECNERPCPIDGMWKEWTIWSECSLTCGGGERIRSRLCVPPQHGGKDCSGSSTETEACNEQPCPVDGYWTLWSNWTACSVSCGGGSRSRSRECIPPMHGGNPCEDINNEEVEECNTQHCPIDGKWSSWSEWSACSVTCGSGIHSRTRTCTPPQYGGKDCEGSSTEVNVCLKSDCIDACHPNPCYRNVRCLNSPDSLHTFACEPCPIGMTGNGTHCQFVNECELANPCAEGVACKDVRVGWRCGPCPQGYSGTKIRGQDLLSAQNSKQICTDVDECLKKRTCHRHAVCTNTIGSYNCTCKQYYKGDGQTCTVDNACELGKHNCGSKDWCNNMGDGKFSCECPVGYVGDGIICLPDTDLDGIRDKVDNCPNIPNGGQENADNDELGDACDNDADNDGIQDEEDNCMFVKNVDQKDADKDGRGDACDNCPTWWNNDQRDSDNDGQGDICDRDVDDDEFIAFGDNCPTVSNRDQTDSDGDGVGDSCDNCKLVTNIDQRDYDEDGIGNGCDTDTDLDKDGIQEDVRGRKGYSFDNCPNLPNADQLDTDSDGLGDACDEDDDNDGIDDASDNCPKVYNPSQRDEDCENDCDADGVPDDRDACPCNKQIQMANFNNFKSVSLAKNQPGRAEKHAVWVLTNNGSEITQKVDNHPAILLGQDQFMDVEFNGTFFVNDEHDDDYAGFVFNYQSNKRFIVVSWKKTNETYSARTPFVSRAMSGIQIKVVDSQSGPGATLRNALWRTGDTGNEVRTIWYDRNFAGWEYKKAYFWNMKYKADTGCMRVKFFSGSTQIVDTGCVCDKTIIGGKIGVFSFSQANVIWSNIRYSCVAGGNHCTSENSLGRTSRR